MEGLKWPVDTCETCGTDLTGVIPKQNEKGNDVSGRLKWTDFCPGCGHGMFVGDRVLPKANEEELARRAAAPVLSKDTTLRDADPEGQLGGAVVQGEASGVPPDERAAALAKADGVAASDVVDPENQLGNEEAEPELTADPDAMPEGMFWCTKCAGRHEKTSGIGSKHTKFAE